MSLKRLLLLSSILILLVSTLIFYFFVFPKNKQSKVSKLSKGTIGAISEVPEYDIYLQDISSLEKELDFLGFWKEKGVGVNREETVERTTAKDLRIVLTNQEQPWGGTYSSQSKKKISSFNFNIDQEGNGNLLLWIDTQSIDNLDRINKTLNQKIFSSLYEITHWDNKGQEDSEYSKYEQYIVREISSGALKYPISVRKR